MSYHFYQLSKKNRYAIRALLELTLWGQSQAVNVRKLASNQEIPIRFLEVILNELKQGGFVISVRGKTGGYILAKSPDQITLGEIIRFMDKNNSVEQGDITHIKQSDSALSDFMDEINEMIGKVCDKLTLQEMSERESKYRDATVINYMI